MYKIPHTTWVGYKANFYRFFVIKMRLTNMGSHLLNPYDDVHLALKVIPPTSTRYSSGFLPTLREDRPLRAVAVATAKEYDGVVPWTIAKPGQTLTYCYVYGLPRGESHYGLYNVIYPTKDHPAFRSILLASLGI